MPQLPQSWKRTASIGKIDRQDDATAGDHQHKARLSDAARRRPGCRRRPNPKWQLSNIAPWAFAALPPLSEKFNFLHG